MVIKLKNYVTISVLKEVKELLEKEKKDKDWSDFLLELFREAKTARARKAFEKLRNLLNDEDYIEIEKSSKEFRRGFKFR